MSAAYYFFVGIMRVIVARASLDPTRSARQTETPKPDCMPKRSHRTTVVRCRVGTAVAVRFAPLPPASHLQASMAAPNIARALRRLDVSIPT